MLKQKHVTDEDNYYLRMNILVGERPNKKTYKNN